MKIVIPYSMAHSTRQKPLVGSHEQEKKTRA